MHGGGANSNSASTPTSGGNIIRWINCAGIPATIPNGDVTSLDDAITCANQTTANETITLTSGELQITTDLAINGPGANNLTVSGNHASRAFNVGGGSDAGAPITVGISGLTIEAGNGHLFALPWRGHTLLATTDTPFSGDPACVGVTQADIDSFLATFRKYLPAANLNREGVEFFYAGLRPLVSDGSKTSYNVSRRAELVDHTGEGMEGLFSALGGKWTTSRALAEKATNAIVARTEKSAAACATATTPLPGGRIDRFDGLVAGMQKTYPGIAALRHLAHMHGARLPLLLKGARLTDLMPLGPSLDVPAQVRFAMREEMALRLEDVVMRRTSLGQFGRPQALAQVAGLMAAELGWSAEKQSQEIAAVDRLYAVAA